MVSTAMLTSVLGWLLDAIPQFLDSNVRLGALAWVLPKQMGQQVVLALGLVPAAGALVDGFHARTYTAVGGCSGVKWHAGPTISDWLDWLG